MNKAETAICQTMIQNQRYLNGTGWPGKPLNAPAKTCYPNVLAEIEASGMYLWCPSDHAGVSTEIMAAVMEDGERLTLRELHGLCGLYGCALDYLSAPTLQTVDPATNKGRHRLWELRERMKQAEGLEVFSMLSIKQTRDTMERGQPVTYAAWRQACQNLNDALRNNARKCRTTRMAEEVQS